MHISTIGSFEAKTKLPEILRAVEQGEQYIITNRGRPVAKLIPISFVSRRPVGEVIQEIENFEPRVSCSKMSTEKMRRIGRR